MKKLLFSAFLLAFFAACVSNDQKPKTTPPPPAPAVDYGYFQESGDSLVIPAFEIKLDMSKRAEQKLQKDKETVIIDATFSGFPTDTTILTEEPFLMIAQKQIELKTERSARFEGIKISKKDWQGLADKDIELLINVFSGRRTHEDNLLSGDIVSEKMSLVKGKTFTLKTRLIVED